MAHFVGSESRHKRKFVKKVKSVRDVDQAFVKVLLVLLCALSVVLRVITRELVQISSGLNLSRRAVGASTRLTGASTASKNTSPLCLRRLDRFLELTIPKFVQLMYNLSG